MYRSVLAMSVIGAGFVGFIGSAAAQGACQTSGTVTQVVGNVLVDQGAGFRTASVGTSVGSGDRISVRGPGRAVVNFGSQQTISVPGSTTQVLRPPGCGLINPNNAAKIIVPSAIIAGGTFAAVEISDSEKKLPYRPISP